MDKWKPPNGDNLTECQEKELDLVLDRGVLAMLGLTSELSFNEFIACLLAASDRDGIDPEYAVFAEHIRNLYVYR